VGVSGLLFQLLCGHAVADFMLQHPWVAQNKSRHSPPAGYDPKLHGARQTIWPYVLTAHALTHGMFVFIATGSVFFGALETVAHWAIDFGKCERWYGIHADQAMHLACKIGWAAWATFGAMP
jgi:hypothetical protein